MLRPISDGVHSCGGLGLAVRCVLLLFEHVIVEQWYGHRHFMCILGT